MWLLCERERPLSTINKIIKIYIKLRAFLRTRKAQIIIINSLFIGGGSTNAPKKLDIDPPPKIQLIKINRGCVKVSESSLQER